MQKIITCTGYHGSGSSAITDLLKEFDNCYSSGEYEFRFIQDPYGISDLEFQLVENFHRLNSGYYLKKYKKKVDFLSGNLIFKRYEKYFNNKFKEYSYEYIRELTKLEWKGEWAQELEDRKTYFYFNRILNKVVRFFSRKKEIEVTVIKNNKLILAKEKKEEFYKKTKKYLEKLFNEINKEKKEFLVMDQLVPSTNIERYNNYFYSLKTIVVDRDPRDLYVLEREYWRDNVIPTKTVEEFIEWFKILREEKIEENENVLKIRFEELVYDYDNTLIKILTFLKIEKHNHIHKKEYFKPEISKMNTKVWEKYPKYRKEILKIETELKDYCWDNK